MQKERFLASLFLFVRIYLWLQVSGGCLGVHVHLRTVFCKEIGDNLRLKGYSGFEITALHVSHDSLAHLTGNKTIIQIGGDVHRGHQQFAIQHISLNKHTEFTADMPCINGLDRWLVVLGQFREVHHTTRLEPDDRNNRQFGQVD